MRGRRGRRPDAPLNSLVSFPRMQSRRGSRPLWIRACAANGFTHLFAARATSTRRRQAAIARRETGVSRRPMRRLLRSATALRVTAPFRRDKGLACSLVSGPQGVERRPSLDGLLPGGPVRSPKSMSTKSLSRAEESGLAPLGATPQGLGLDAEHGTGTRGGSCWSCVHPIPACAGMTVVDMPTDYSTGPPSARQPPVPPG